MASIHRIATTVPPQSFGPEAIVEAGQSWLSHSSSEALLFQRFVSSSQTSRRFFVSPIGEILKPRGMKERARIFEEEGTALGTSSAAKVFEGALLGPEEIDVFIFTSCSSPVIPSIDGLIAQQIGLRPDVLRLPIYQHGCAGGIIGLALASQFAQSSKNVLLCSVEVCSLGFYREDHSAGHLVGSAIFADGSASAIISAEDSGLVFLDSQSILTEDSRHLMGYDLEDNGAHLRLDKELPSFLSRMVPGIVHAFLEKHGLSSENVDWWLFHPGGIKVLNSLEQTLSLEPRKARWAREVLTQYGNLSSASVLFVASEFTNSDVAKNGDLVMMIGMGPGLTIELILFRYARNSQLVS